MKGTKDRIELVGKSSEDSTHYIFTLYINGYEQDKLKVKIHGNENEQNFWILSGVLNGYVPIRVELLRRPLLRPEYTFYVADQEVHTEKGTWFGI